MLRECKKFPPKTRESSVVSTAWIHPVGMNNVWPSRTTHLKLIRMQIIDIFIVFIHKTKFYNIQLYALNYRIITCSTCLPYRQEIFQIAYSVVAISRIVINLLELAV